MAAVLAVLAGESVPAVARRWSVDTALLRRWVQAFVEVVVDPELFRRVLRGLWDAGRSLPTPRLLRLEVAEVPPWTELRIVLDADPIETRVLQALLEPFELNDDGTGETIGLYLARALSVAHGGAVGVQQDVATGFFWVRVPRGPRASEGPLGDVDPATLTA